MKSVKKFVTVGLTFVMLLGVTSTIFGAEHVHNLKCVYHSQTSHIYYCQDGCGYESVLPHLWIVGKCGICGYVQP